MTWIRNVADTELGKERRIALCNFLAEYVGRERVAPSRAEIAAELDVSIQAVQKHIGILIEDGILEDLGGGRGLRLK